MRAALISVSNTATVYGCAVEMWSNKSAMNYFPGIPVVSVTASIRLEY